MGANILSIARIIDFIEGQLEHFYDCLMGKEEGYPISAPVSSIVQFQDGELSSGELILEYMLHGV